MTARWIVTFDVASDADRRAIHGLLGHHGIRILYTVYEIAATEHVLNQLIDKLKPHVGPRDHLLALPHCEQCRSVTRGHTIEKTQRHGWIAT